MISRPRALGYGFLSHTSVKDSNGASQIDPKSCFGRKLTGRARSASERAVSKAKTGPRAKDHSARLDDQMVARSRLRLLCMDVSKDSSSANSAGFTLRLDSALKMIRKRAVLTDPGRGVTSIQRSRTGLAVQ
jgi:hypothetical protein